MSRKETIMSKIKLIYYRPYEYELLQETLNQLANDGYDAKQLHLLTLFKKTQKHVHYIVDVFHSTQKSINGKLAVRDKFLDPYLERYCFK